MSVHLIVRLHLAKYSHHISLGQTAAAGSLDAGNVLVQSDDIFAWTWNNR